jgi:hypothetical protein
MLATTETVHNEKQLLMYNYLMRRKVREPRYFIRDLCIVALSIIIAYYVVKIGILGDILSLAQGTAIISSFVAGLFFTSVFTIAPASVALAELSEMYSVPTVALWGALGALIGDLIIFFFIRDTVTDDISYVTRKLKLQKYLSLFNLGFLRVLTPIIGALIIASPLPDELGIAMMGLARTPTYTLVLISFVMNFIGILLISAVGSIF